MNSIYSLIINSLINITIIKIENILIYDKRNTIIIGFCKNKEILIIITPKSEQVLRIIY